MPKKPIAIIDQERCIGCPRCIMACPFDAIVMNEDEKAYVIDKLCRGCMRCAYPCPVDAISKSLYV